MGDHQQYAKRYRPKKISITLSTVTTNGYILTYSTCLLPLTVFIQGEIAIHYCMFQNNTGQSVIV